MTAKTKKYQLDHKTYIRLGLRGLLKKEWWIGALGAALIITGAFVPAVRWWLISIGFLGPVLYMAFRAMQFTAITQHEMGKILFYKMSYEISGENVMLKIDSRHGMPVQWNQIKNVLKTNDAYIFYLSKVQFFHIPFQILKSENDMRLVDAILKRKKLIAAE